MIEGVVVSKINTHKDSRGFFREIFRFSENFKNLSVGQISHSRVDKNVIKGWHGHAYQHQWNYVSSGLIKVALLDNRKDSSTYMQLMEINVGDDDNPCAYYFPPGVLHGYKCLYGPMNIIYVTSGVYDLTDEIRVGFDDFTNPYKF
jgi:dTDP-4-dehydrorhamnose 3,5-epimerase